MELVTGGELLEHSIQNSHQESNVASIMRQILTAVQYLHDYIKIYPPLNDTLGYEKYLKKRNILPNHYSQILIKKESKLSDKYYDILMKKKR